MGEVSGRPVIPGTVEGLFFAEWGRLVGSLALVAGSREVAADAVQEAFVAAHLRWARVGSLDDPAGWVRRVALNRIYSHHRRLRLRRRRAVAGGVDPEARDDEVVAVRADVAVAVATLSLRQRTAVALHYLEDLSVEETAREMGVTVGAVKTHLYRARNQLRSLLEVS